MVKKRADLADHSFSRRNADRDRDAGLQRRDREGRRPGDVFALIISSGGNSGSQATTLVIRAMALGEVTIARLVSCDPQGTCRLGLLFGADSWNDRIFRGSRCGHARPAILSPPRQSTDHWPLVALTVGIALVGVVLWGTLSGSMLPFVCDVSARSGNLFGAIRRHAVDVTGLMIYFNVALLILRGTML